MSDLKVGDKVTWTHVKMSGSRFGFTTKQGTIIEVCKNCYVVKDKRGKLSYPNKPDVRLEGHETELTELVKAGFFKSAIK